MKNLILGLGLMALVACQSDPEKKAAVETSPGGHAFAHLPIFDEGVNDITVHIAWPTDYAWRDDVNPFVPHIAAEAILSEGAAGLNPQELMEAFNDKNAFGRLQIAPDHVFGTLSFPYEHTEFVQSVATEVLQSPTYSEDWLKRVIDQVATNQAKSNQQEHTQLWAAARMAVLGDTPFYHSLTDTDPELASEVQRDDVLEWHKTYLTREPEAISIAGRITADDAGALVDQLLSGLPENTRPIEPRNLGNFAPINVFLENPDAEKTMFGMIGNLPASREGQDHVDLIALRTLSMADGPLFDAVRTDLRAAYAVYSGKENYDRANRFLYIFAEVEAGKLEQSLEVVRETYDAYRTNPPKDDFEAMQSSLVTNIKDRVEYVDVAAQTVLQLMLDGFDPSEIDGFSDRFEAVTMADATARMTEVYPLESQLIVVATGPDATAWPGACVIREVKEVLTCPRSPGS